ncbi:MAG TPA: molybdopterin-dependent oxidoreductase [Acetobacteraceae bacterium]|jgi:anaerobic selenocysteine-containing dehydrogenase
MPDAATEHRLQGYCGLCIARCGTVATVRDGRFTRLDPDPTHPTGQALCAKGRAAPELVYSPERLTHPLRRTRPKGEADPGWQRIGWDEALDEVAAAMRRIADAHGSHAVCFSQSSASTTAIGDAGPFIRRLMNAFGSPNAMTSVDVCGWGRAGATRHTFGVGAVATGGGGGAMADIAHAGCLILWGYNPSASRLTHATAVVEALKRGMKLIVVDPRHAGLANKADLWLRVRPGTDGALALGIANQMIEHGWYDRDFIRTWSNGPMLVRADNGRMLMQDGRFTVWDSVAERAVPYGGDCANHALEGKYRVGDVVCHPAFELYARMCRRYTPEHVEETCWIPRAQIEEAARLMWHARPVSYYAWSGHEQQANVTQTARAMSVLYALTGSFDAPGGNVLLPAVPSGAVTGEDLPAAKRMAPTLGIGERPLGPGLTGNVTAREIYRAILEGTPYPVRGLIGFGSNMLLAHADGGYGRTALAALEFYAHCDMFLSPTAAMADIVLPVASCFEREALKLGFEISPEAQSHIQFRQAVLPPIGESRPDTDIIFDLAARLGLAAVFWDGDVEAAYRQQLAPSGVTLEQLRASPGGVHVPLQAQYRKYAAPDAHGVPRGFATPSRRVELYSQTFLDHGYAPLPDFEEPPIGPATRPDLAARFPLVLTCAKPTVFCQTQHRGLPSLRRRSLDPQIDLHPAAARARGIAAGDWVTIETPDARVRARARFNDTLDPRVAVGEHGWWQACAELGAPGYDPFGPDGSNFNLLIGSQALDPVSGTASLRAYLCEIRRA